MNAAEVIDRFEQLTEQIGCLEGQRDALPKVAAPWRGRYRGFYGTNKYASAINNISGVWLWRTYTTEKWHPATPNTEAGAKACAEAQLTADGVLLA